jgi:hypothetical protein
MNIEIYLDEKEAEKIRNVLGETKQATFSQFCKVATIRRADRLMQRDPMKAKNV